MTSFPMRLDHLVGRIEHARGLDRVAETIAPLAERVTRSRSLERTLSGAPLGHRLHPMLTDIPIGCWTTGSLLDLIAWRSSARPARQIVGLGLLASIPTVLSGLSDWRDTRGPSRRLGVVHMTSNALAITLEAASWSARRKGHHARGALCGIAGIAAATVGGYLGGHLVFAERVGVDVEVPVIGDDKWHGACAESDLFDGRPLLATIGDAPVMVVRRNGAVFALADVCPHAGGPLHEGDVDDDAVTCPWHGSQFCLRDGSVRRGPAARAQAVYETRVRAGTVEVRRASAAFTTNGHREHVRSIP